MIVVLSSLLAIYQGQRRTVAESHERQTKLLLDQKSQLAGELQTALHRSMLGTMHVQLERVGDILPHDPQLARRLLLDETKCPPDIRDFAWGHYSHLANRERATLHGTATLSSDAEVLALVTTAGALELWATSPLQHLHTVPPSADGRWRVLAISRDSRILAATSMGTDLFLVDVRTGSISKWNALLSAPALRGSFSHDSRLLAVLSPNSIHVLELDNPFRAPWLAFQGEGFDHLQFVDDGCFFATQTRSGRVVVVDVHSQDLKLFDLGGAISAISEETGSIAHVDGNLELGLRSWKDGFASRIAVAGRGSGNSAVFSNDGSLLALADQSRLGTLIATQFELIRPGQPSPVFQRSDMDGRRRGAARAIALPPHNRFLVACRGNGQIELMTIPDGMQPAPVPPSIVLGEHRATQLAITRDGTTLISVGEHESRVWDLAGGITRLPNGSLALSSDGSHLVTSHLVSQNSHSLAIIERRTGVSRIISSGGSGISNAVCSRTGKYVAYRTYGAEIRIVQVATYASQLIASTANDSVVANEFSPDEKSFLVAYPGRLETWRVATGKKLKAWTLPKEQCLAASFSPQGSTIASAHRSGVVKLWDADDGDLRATLEGSRFAIAPDDKFIVTSQPENWFLQRDTEYVPCLWDLETGKKLRALKGFLGGGAAFSFSSNSQFLAISGIGADKRIEVWDLRSLELHTVLECEQFSPFRVALSPNGSTLAASGFPREVRLWNTTTGDLQGTFPFDNDFRFGFIERFLDNTSLLLAQPGSMLLFDGSQYAKPHVTVGEPWVQKTPK